MQTLALEFAAELVLFVDPEARSISILASFSHPYESSLPRERRGSWLLLCTLCPGVPAGNMGAGEAQAGNAHSARFGFRDRSHERSRRPPPQEVAMLRRMLRDWARSFAARLRHAPARWLNSVFAMAGAPDRPNHEKEEEFAFELVRHNHQLQR